MAWGPNADMKRAIGMEGEAPWVLARREGRYHRGGFLDDVKAAEFVGGTGKVEMMAVEDEIMAEVFGGEGEFPEGL